ncbi:hypothetical protein OIE71_09190 [Streptomyces sp. NBC_01725]|nr:hypothetical protein [Streptomyces sp. NBC_01725]
MAAKKTVVTSSHLRASVGWVEGVVTGEASESSSRHDLKAGTPQ